MHLGAAAVLTALLLQPGSAVLNVGGFNIPADAINNLSAPLTDIIKHRGTAQTFADLLPIAETVSDFYFPGSGFAESLVVYAAARARPPTKQEQQRMWDRAQGDH